MTPALTIGMDLPKRFKKVDGTYIDVVKHTIESLKQNPHTQIHIGTDSQNLGEITCYVTVIAYRYGTNGVHYILHKQKVPRIKDMWSRLWKETEMTLEVAEWMKQKLPFLELIIDMDFNDDKYWASNQLITAAKGWAQSLGYKVNTKPVTLIACRAADYNCHS